MKNHNYLKLLALPLVALLLSAVSCKTATKVSNEYAGYGGYKTECLGIDPDGTQRLRTWGQGANKEQAMEQAKRKAVEAVIFSGIIDGVQGCNKRPLVNEVNAREKYEDYFNTFFRDGGAYNLYVRLDEKRTSRIKSQNSAQEAFGVIVSVDRSALRKRLIDDNVIDN